MGRMLNPVGHEQTAFIWTHRSRPILPWKIFLVEADYRPHNDRRPCYEVCAQSKKAATSWFRLTYPWLKVHSVTEAPLDYQPCKWLFDKDEEGAPTVE